ncbi:MAG: hypothetical protein RIG63_22995 [Coleofasciculus chthonoplastes F3-SA18-01]|uniref:hypothetical protein n=1 Tax=Coleofasciculus chthonoplastes TaxID=64178 RepID=UPI0032F6EBFE
MTANPRVTVGNEYQVKKQQPEVAKIYPDGIHHAIAQQGIRDWKKGKVCVETRHGASVGAGLGTFFWLLIITFVQNPP